MGERRKERQLACIQERSDYDRLGPCFRFVHIYVCFAVFLAAAVSR